MLGSVAPGARVANWLLGLRRRSLYLATIVSALAGDDTVTQFRLGC